MACINKSNNSLWLQSDLTLNISCSINTLLVFCIFRKCWRQQRYLRPISNEQQWGQQLHSFWCRRPETASGVYIQCIQSSITYHLPWICTRDYVLHIQRKRQLNYCMLARATSVWVFNCDFICFWGVQRHKAKTCILASNSNNCMWNLVIK